MGINKVFWTCPKCDYSSVTEEIITEQGERFINCVRCGSFTQMMLKTALKNIDEVKKLYPNYIETETYITIQSGGWGTWKIIQQENTHEGSFVSEEHIHQFLNQMDEMMDVSDVIEIQYSIKDQNNKWIEITRKKN